MTDQVSLYNLNKKMLDIDAALTAGGGEITPELEEALSKLSLLVEKSTDEIVAYTEYLKDAIQIVREKKQQLGELQASYVNRLDKFRKLVIQTMENMGKQKQETVLSSITLPKKIKRLYIEHENLLPVEYLTHIPEKYEPNKKKIEMGLKSGLQIAGATLVDGEQSVRIGRKR